MNECEVEESGVSGGKVSECNRRERERELEGR